MRLFKGYISHTNSKVSDSLRPSWKLILFEEILHRQDCLMKFVIGTYKVCLPKWGWLFVERRGSYTFLVYVQELFRRLTSSFFACYHYIVITRSIRQHRYICLAQRECILNYHVPVELRPSIYQEAYKNIQLHIYREDGCAPKIYLSLKYLMNCRSSDIINPRAIPHIPRFHI